MKAGKVILAAAIAGIAFLSCSKESIKTTYSRQETYIETFLTNALSTYDSSYVVSNGGSQRLVIEKGDGDDSLSKDGTVSFYYAGYVLSGTTISSSDMFYTNSQEWADSVGWETSDTTLFKMDTVKLSSSKLVSGLRKGLVGVRDGQECYILFSGKYGFGDKDLGTIPANSALAYHIWVGEISN
jgi:FKBP-type peptidyl-prolyl cis-trans isomerase